MPGDISVFARGRELKITGNVEVYLASHAGYNMDDGSVFRAAKDIPSGSTILDVGANIGVVATSLAVQRPDCKIIAVEPVPSNFECLLRNLKANDITNVEAVNAAASDTAGFVKMTDNGPWSAVMDAAPLTIEAIPIDRFIEHDVSFVKIDCEGYEPNVFAGGRKLFDKHKPLIHVEFNSICLMVKGYDPLAFANALCTYCEVLGVFHFGNSDPPARNGLEVVYSNVVKHGGVSDLFLRAKSTMPDLIDLCYTQFTCAAVREVDRLNQELAGLLAKKSRQPSAISGKAM